MSKPLEEQLQNMNRLATELTHTIDDRNKTIEQLTKEPTATL